MFDESFIMSFICTLACFIIACYCGINVVCGDLSAGQFVVCLLSGGLFSAFTCFSAFCTFYPVFDK